MLIADNPPAIMYIMSPTPKSHNKHIICVIIILIIILLRRTVPGLNRTNFRREGSEIYTCDVCDEKFYSDVSLATHNADYHSTLLCDICDESICGVIEFITHKHSHSSKPGRMGGDDVRCVLCNMKFVTNQVKNIFIFNPQQIQYN